MKSLLFAFVLISCYYLQAPAQNFAPLTAGGDKTDLAAALCRDAQGNTVLGGWTQSFGDTLGDALISCFDAQGQLNWLRSYGGNLDDGVSSIQALPDGGFILAGHTASFGMGLCDYYLIRLDAAGDTVWTRAIGTELDEACSGVALAADGNYLVTGFEEEPIIGFRSATLFKVSPAGELLWHHSWQVATWCGTSGLCLTEAGEIILFGTCADDFLGEEDLFLLRTNAEGELLWQRRLVQAGTEHVYAMAMRNGEFYLTGYQAQKQTEPRNIFLAHASADGSLLQFTVNETAGDQMGRAIAFNAKGQAVVTGWDRPASETAIPFLTFDPITGQILNVVSIGAVGDDFVYAMLPVEGDFILAGKTNDSPDGSTDAMLLRVNEEGSPLNWVDPLAPFTFNVFPNPGAGEFHLKIPVAAGALLRASVIDAVGREWKLDAISEGNEARVNLVGMPAGIYLLHCIFEQGEATQAVWLNP